MVRIKSKAVGGSPSGELSYMNDAQRPVSSLIFLLPMVAIYELGTFLLAGNLSDAIAERVIAFQLLRQFFGLFGATSFHLPGLALLAILAAWHLATGDRWQIRWRTICVMGVESLLLAIPLVVLSHVAAGYENASQLSGTPPGHIWARDLLLSVGAGIYEELLFRLMLISLLSVILMDLARVPEGPAVFAIVIVSGVAFSMYHYLGPEPFVWSSFMFRTVAGVYLAGVFMLRGFGITVGCHATYDILTMVLNAL